MWMWYHSLRQGGLGDELIQDFCFEHVTVEVPVNQSVLVFVK